MAWDGPIEKIGDYKFKVPKGYKPGMQTDGVVFASPVLLENAKKDNCLEQVANMTFLPGIVGTSEAMPDIHWGYGFPIGGVAATDFDQGVISPGGVGFDINCGVRLLRTNLYAKDIKKKLPKLIDAMFDNIPSGLGSKGKVRVSERDIQDVMVEGAKWAVEKGYGRTEDPETLEEFGAMQGADPEVVGEKPCKRGMPQLGSLGSGNHFLEIQRVGEIFEEDTAKVMGITSPDQIMVMIHTGSRGLGYQVCSDQLKELEKNFHKQENNFVSDRFDVSLPDRQLVCAPVHSDSGDNYFKAMKCAANYAWANRQLITHWVRHSFSQVLGGDSEDYDLGIVYDVAHNIAKEEEHIVDGKRQKLIVHRKGATRAFGPGSKGLVSKYSEIGQPVLIPGDMGSSSYVLVGTETAMNESFGSTCHGAGRVMSRKEATRRFKVRDVVEELGRQGVIIKSASKEGITEEAPQAYKDVDDVIETAQGAGISRKVVKLKPMGVIKG